MRIYMVDAAGMTIRYDYLLCSALSRAGHQVTLFGPNLSNSLIDSSDQFRYQSHFYRVSNALSSAQSLRLIRPYVKAVEHLLDMIRFIRIVKREKPDVIHFQWSQLPLFDRLFFRALKKCSPLVYTIHNSTPLHGERPPLHQLQTARYYSIMHSFDALIVHTNYSKDVIKHFASVKEAMISVVPHGLLNYFLDFKEIHSVSARYGIEHKKNIILFFGNISYYKGLDVLIEAFGLLPAATLKDTVLLVVGRPRVPIKPLRELAKSLGISHHVVWDLRYVAEDEIDRIFSVASIIAMPYRHIDQSGVLASAVSYGKPILATNIGGFSEILQDRVHGRLVPPESPVALSEAMVDLLSQESALSQIRNAVHELATKWPNWDTIASMTVSVYTQVRSERTEPTNSQ